MRVILIDLGSNRDELNEPLGIELIAGNLLKKMPSWEVRLHWLLIEQFENIIFSKDDIIGISAKIGTYNILEKVLNKLSYIEYPVIVGGPLATYGNKSLLKKHKSIILVSGEGESSFTDLCQLFSNKKKENLYHKLKDIPNLIYFQEENVITTIRRPEKLEQLEHPKRYFIDTLVEEGGIVRVENSRGCSYGKCSFCSVSYQYNCSKWRPFEIEFIIDELKSISEMGCRSPYFTDEDFFGGDYDRAEKLAQKIIEMKKENLINPEMNFFFDLRVNDVIHPKGYHAIKLWKLAGLREVFLGIESGVNSQLNRYKKPVSEDSNLKAISKIKKLNLQLDFGYILFDPEMTFQELKNNIYYLEDIKLSDSDARSIKKMRAQPMTKLTEQYFHNNLINGDLDLQSISYPLRYKDKEVENVKNEFELFEMKFAKDVYLLQAISRGEVENEKVRLNIKQGLAEIRRIDFQYLKLIIKYIDRKLSLLEINGTKYEMVEKKQKNINTLKKQFGL